MIPNDAPDTKTRGPQALHSAPIRGQTPSGSKVSDGDNVVDLLKELAGQGAHLAEQQLALVKAEIRESASEMKAAAGSMAGAAIVGLAGAGVTLMGIAFFLGIAIDNTPLATLIVGLAALAIAYVLYRSGSDKMSADYLSPDRTQRTLQRTSDVVLGNLNTEQTR